jgi:folate-binding protein YgfZ
MTQTNTSVSLPATALALLMAEAAAPQETLVPIQVAAPPELRAYRGARTPCELDAPAKETAAMLSGVAVHDLGWLRRVAVEGEDRFRWLSGMVTNTVNELGAQAGAWNLVLNAQGHVLGDLHVWREGNGLSLVIAADQYDRLLAHLERFIIMDDVELAPRSEIALGLAGPLAGELLVRLEMPEPAEPLTSASADWNGLQLRVARAYGLLVPHYELWTQAAGIPALWRALVEAGATAVGAATLEAFRIVEAIPAYGIDIVERDLPQEAVPAPPQVALNFNKGCYQGQEIVERIHSRGSVHRHLRPLEIFGPLPPAGTELMRNDGVTAGEIRSAALLLLATGNRSFALGMIRAEAEISPQRLKPVVGDSEIRSQEFTYAGGTAHILAAPPLLQLS